MLKSKQHTVAGADDATLAADIAAYKAVFDVAVQPAKAKPAAVDRNDPSTWARPNLDNLKASILSDWKAAA